MKAPKSAILPISTFLLATLAYQPVLLTAQDGEGTDDRDLSSVFELGYDLRDLNGDGIVDQVWSRVLLPPEPSEAEVAAASNLAARLGFETVSTDLGLIGAAAAGSDRPVLVVGDRALALTGAALVVGVLRGLAPGQGALVHLEPNGTLTEGGVAIVGYDATGLLAAATYLAGRFPAVWSVDGDTWSDATAGVEEFFDGHSLGGQVGLHRIVVDAATAGVRVAEMGVRFADPSARTRAMQILRGEVDDEVSSEPNPEPEGEAEPTVPPLSDLSISGVQRLDISILGDSDVEPIPIRSGNAEVPPEDSAFRPAQDVTFSLPALYSIDGLFRDTNRDLVADETAAHISLSGGSAAGSVVDFATRIGLETAGIRLPLVSLTGQTVDPQATGFPILIGIDHYVSERLIRSNDLIPVSEEAGQGYVQLFDGAVEGRNGMVISGTDPGGLEATLDWLSRRAPYLWTYGKGEYGLKDAETEIRRFFQAVKSPGKVALALAKLSSWMDRLADQPVSRVEVEFAAPEVPDAVTSVAESIVHERFPAAEVSVETWSTGFGVGDTIFVDEWELDWEVDEVRELLEARVYPRVQSGQPASVEVRVSEPPEIRDQLAEEIRAALTGRGASSVQVQVLSAYKQGYSWLNDSVLPRLQDLDVASIEIIYHTLEESEEVRWQTVAAETRWLQELYPIDAILARDLDIADSLVTFRPTRTADPIYTVVARDEGGAEVFRDMFDPVYVVRPFFDLFPDYEQVRVTTGVVRAESGGNSLIDQRVVTDPERFWDRLQTDTYQQIIDYVMDTQDGRPSGANAPYFDEFHIDLRMSEPNYRIGVGEEVISSLEALHEDIYFETLTLFDLIGARYQTSLPFPGRVLPYIDSTGAGAPGRARLSFTGKAKGVPEIRVRTWQSADSEPELLQYRLGTLAVDPPRLVGASVTSGAEGLDELMVRVTVPDSVDRYPEFEQRSSEAAVDRQFMNVELLSGMVDALERLHTAGAFEGALSWDRVGELTVDFRVEADSTYRSVTGLPRSERPQSTDNPRLRADDWSWDGTQITQWDTPMPPSESDSLLAVLSTFPEVSSYYLAESFLGQPVWAADFLPTHAGQFLSQAKLNALKPTLFISGRQHANEVSSTSHILRLGELLATDSTYREMLKKVNVVLHPITNPDGARLAVEMQETNPDFMLHAGYLGALGVDATSGERSDDPIYPESQARRLIRETWLPDIYINMHGYPSHEWVQYFAGYSAWVRSRNGGQRSWWTPRGWFIPGFSITEDDENPEYGQAQTAILDSMAAAMTGEADINRVSQEMYARYRRYGEQDRTGFREYFHNGMLVNMGLRGSESIGNGPFSTRITYFSTTTEAPDETARGDWLNTVATMGLTHSTALLRYLASGEFEIKRENAAFDRAVTRKVFRLKPVLPKEPVEDTGAGSGGR